VPKTHRNAIKYIGHMSERARPEGVGGSTPNLMTPPVSALYLLVFALCICMCMDITCMCARARVSDGSIRILSFNRHPSRKTINRGRENRGYGTLAKGQKLISLVEPLGDREGA